MQSRKQHLPYRSLWLRSLAVLACLIFTAQAVCASDPITNHLTNWPKMADISEDSAVLMDAENGALLYSLDRDVTRYPASTTKIMTCLLTIEHTKGDEIVTMTETGMAEAYSGSSNILPKLGEQFTVDQCLDMLMLKSANDIAAQLAEFVGGSVAGFCDMMNEKALSLGCTGTHFHNANGMPDDEHYTTAHDLAKIMRGCLQNEKFRSIIRKKQVTIPPTNLTDGSRVYDNHNKLILEDSEYFYAPCIGGKTGYTDAAQRTLVTAAEKDGRTLICVTMHGPDARDFADHKALYEYGFENFSRQPIRGETEEYAVDGSVTLPAGISAEALSFTDAEQTDGAAKRLREYSYETVPVGSAVLVRHQTPTARPAGEGGGILLSDPREDRPGGKRLLILFLCILSVLLLLLLARMVFVEYERARRRKRRRKKRNTSKKKK